MKVVSFGEIMLRLTPKHNNRIAFASSFDALYGGAEANVAVSLRNLNVPAEFVSKVPNNFLGNAAISALNKYNVQTNRIAQGGERLGLYYYEKGAGLRNSLCFYDRKGSAFSLSSLSDYDFDKIFEGATLFHLTGITPALSPQMFSICEIALKKAKEKGITISFDTNYRSKLWDMKAASDALKKLAVYADILFATPWDAENIYNVDFNALTKKYKYLAHTVRKDGYSGVLYVNGEKFVSKKYDLTIVDRVGAGDAFSAGIIYSYLNNLAPQGAVDFAAAAGYIKHTIEGDFNIATVDEINGIIANNGANSITR